MATSPEITLRLAGPEDAPAFFAVIHEAFSVRPPLDPPAEALSDTLEDIELHLASGYGVAVHVDDELAGCLILDVEADAVTLRRVSVLPRHARHRVAVTMVKAALELAADLGCRRAELVARVEFPQLIEWWRGRGFQVVATHGHNVEMARDVPRLLTVDTAEGMHRLGIALAGLMKPGDVVIATGELGAGKTTLAQGIGAGLGVEGPVISPTFVISRVHPSLSDGPALVHVDAYRMGTGAELADIDLDSSLPTSVTLVEWGAGKAEWLSSERLEIRIEREGDGDVRTVLLDGIGRRWDGVLNTLEWT